MCTQPNDDFEKVKFILENQQKEMRAYDQKAGSYIASNSGLFVIALFTLCVFNMFHVGNSDIEQFGIKWWFLLGSMIIYSALFIVANTFSLFVLFPRVKNKYSFSRYDETITNFSSDTVAANLDNTLKNTIAELDFFSKEHIKANVGVLKAKHFFAKPILGLSIAMGVSLLALIVLLFCF